MSRTWFARLYGGGERWVRSGSDKRLGVTVPPLSAVVYVATRRIERSRRAPSIALKELGTLRDRAEIGATVGGDGFAEVTFFARSGRGGWTPIGTDDNAPYRVFHDVADLAPGSRVEYKAVVVDNAGHERTSSTRSATVAPPAIALEAPADGGRVRGEVEVRAVATPEHANYVVTLYRSVNGGAWTSIGTDDSSPVYTAFDDTTALTDDTVVRYKAVLTYAPGRTVESDARSVTVVSTPVATAIVHYKRPAGDYADWGLHLWGDAIADGVGAPTGTRRASATRVDGVRRRLPDPAQGRHQAGELHHAPAGRGRRARHARAGRRPQLRAARPPGDLARAGRPGGVLQPAELSVAGWGRSVRPHPRAITSGAAWRSSASRCPWSPWRRSAARRAGPLRRHATARAARPR